LSEEQIVDITVNRGDLSDHDTGGGYRSVKAEIIVDSSLPPIRQREVVIHEVLGAYLGIVVSPEDIAELAGSINDALCQLEGE